MPRPLEFTLSLPLSHSLNITLAMHSELERQFKDTTARKYDCCQEKKHPQGPKHVQHNHRLSRFPCPPSSCLDLQRGRCRQGLAGCQAASRDRSGTAKKVPEGGAGLCSAALEAASPEEGMGSLILTYRVRAV